MVLSSLTQPELARRLEILTSNGRLPEAQAVIARVGFNEEALQQLAGEVNTWLIGITDAEKHLTEQKLATELQHQVRKDAQNEINRLKQAARTLFAEDETLLEALYIRPRRSNGSGKSNGANGNDTNGNGTNGHDNGSSRATNSRFVSRSTAATIVRWRCIVTAAQNLPEESKAALAAIGWDADRLAGLTARIEAYAEADTQQEKAKETYRDQKKINKALEQNLRKRYKQARQLIKLAIEDTDPDIRAQWNGFFSM